MASYRFFQIDPQGSSFQLHSLTDEIVGAIGSLLDGDSVDKLITAAGETVVTAWGVSAFTAMGATSDATESTSHKTIVWSD